MPDFLSYRGQARIRLDPRTSLLALVVVNVVCLGAGLTGQVLWARVLATALPLVLLAAQRRWVAALVCAAATGLALVMETVGLDGLIGLRPATTGEHALALLALAAGAVANLVARFLPVILMGWYVITTTRVGDLMGALGRLRIPRSLSIPLAVVLRMVPVFAAESAGIGQAARTRGLRVGLARPWTLINYRVVPLTLRAVDISDELTQAGLTRGLDAAVPRTCLGRIGFHWLDAVVIAWAVASAALFGLGL